MPVAAHSLLYMLIVVKPGIVLISLTNTSPRCPSTRKSTRLSPAPSIARNASIGERLQARAHLVGHVGGNREPARAVEILGFVVVELARRHDLAGHRRDRVVVAEHGHLDLSRVRHGGLDHDLAIVVGRELEGLDQLLARPRLGDADARSEIGRLDEHRQAEPAPRVRRRRRPARRARAAAAPPRTAHCGRPCAPKTRFISALSMPTAEASTPQPTYGTLASSSRPCTVPSSPCGPCSTGTMTSRPTPVTMARDSSSPRACVRSMARMVSSLGRGSRWTSRPARSAFSSDARLLDHLGGRGRGRRLVGQRPAPVAIDADRHRLVAGAIEVGHDRGGRGDRDFVLARAATVDDAHAQFLQGLWESRRRPEWPDGCRSIAECPGPSRSR